MTLRYLSSSSLSQALRRTASTASILRFKASSYYLPRMNSSTATTTNIPRSLLNDAIMATSTNIHLSPETNPGIISHNVSEESARAASEVLQEDMLSHHVFFNQSGFHSMFPLSHLMIL